MKKLYLLWTNDPAAGGYDVADGFIVRAKDHARARELAANACGCEGRDVWLNTARSTCRMLEREGREGVIMRDFHAG